MNKRRQEPQPVALSSASIRHFDLLPDAFRDEVETSRVRGFWILSFSLLSICLGHLVMTDWFRHQANRRFETMLREKAEPALRIREEVRRHLDVQTTKKRWIEQVETARPDDGLLQTLAVVSMAVASEADNVKVDSIDISVSTELPTAGSHPASNDDARELETATTPTLVVIARSDTDSVANVVSNLSAQPRIGKLVVEQPLTDQPSEGDETQFKLIGIPRQTKVLP
jgi:type II secretory pathway component PulL